MKAKELYLAKNLEELNKKTLVPPRTYSQAPKLLANSVEKLLKEGKTKEEVEKDEEQAYLMYMKGLDILQHVLKNPKVSSTDRDYYKKLHNPESIFEKCQKLSDSLKKRYELNTMADKLESETILAEKAASAAKLNGSSDKKSEAKLKPGMNGISQKVNNLDRDVQNDNDLGDMTVKTLKNLIEQKSTPLLIIDCRAASDFMNAHIDHPNCISVPSEMLVQGHSAHKIGEVLRAQYPASYMDWSKRAERFEKIILYDWNSSFEHQGPALQVVYDAITKWDFQTNYKSKPYVIQGGLRNIYYSYPTLVNKPQNVNEAAAPNIERLVSATATLAINSISYPSFDDEDSKINSAKSNNQHSSIAQHSINVTNIVVNGEPNPSNNATFDRSKKPTTKVVTPMVNGHSLPSTQNSVEDESLPLIQKETTPSTIYAINNNNNNILSDVNSPTYTPTSTPKNEVVKAPSNLSNLSARKEEPVSKTLNSERGIPGVNTVNGLKDHQVDDRNERKEAAYIRNDNTSVTTIRNDISSSTSTNLSFKPTIPDPKTKPVRTRTNTSPGADTPPTFINGGSPQITITKLKDDYDSPRSSVLKRSHSNPNISQFGDSYDDDSLSALKPDFNRGLKPSNRALSGDYVRRRDFDVVSSTAKTETGLKNLGNTCYMNSIMQCINHSTSLVNYFLSQTYRQEMNSRGPSKGEVTEEVARAIIEMNKGHRSIGLHDLKTAFGKFNKTFRSSEQQDSHEFLTFLLDHMHEELNKGKKQPFKEQKNDGKTDFNAANIAWSDYVTSNDSIIVELFCGQQKSSVRCMACDKSSTTFDTFFVLSIPIPDSRIPGKRYSLQECLDLYTAEEEINDWGCANCKTNGKAKKKIDLWRLPPTLIIHFQRFYVDSYCKKRITDIDFPVDSLDLTRLVKDRRQISSSSSWKYQLFGTSNHYGTMDSGHYTAYCRKNKNWAKFDDQEVCAMMPGNVPSAAAYILFFSQVQ